MRLPVVHALRVYALRVRATRTEDTVTEPDIEALRDALNALRGSPIALVLRLSQPTVIAPGGSQGPVTIASAPVVIDGIVVSVATRIMTLRQQRPQGGDLIHHVLLSDIARIVELPTLTVADVPQILDFGPRPS